MSGDRQAVVTCVEMTARGTRCKRAAMKGSDRCSAHVQRSVGGQQSLLNEAVADKLVAMLRAGNYVGVAARAAGIGRRTFNEWMQRGRNGEAQYAELRERVATAIAEGEARNVATIARAASDEWPAAAWILERHYPGRWGRVPVSARGVDDGEAEPSATSEQEPDPFAEVDELAAQRRKRAEG